MTRVLAQQHVTSRYVHNSSRSTNSRGRERTPAVHSSRVRNRRGVGYREQRHRPRGLFRTVALLTITGALLGTLFFVLPGLWAEADFAASSALLAEVDLPGAGFLPPTDRPVEFQRTEELEYLVSEGETLSEIADRFDVTVRSLVRHNALANPDVLRRGQVIRIPPADPLSDR